MDRHPPTTTAPSRPNAWRRRRALPPPALRGLAAALAGWTCATALAAVGWNVEAPLGAPRTQHAAALLDDGSVVVVNGVNSSGFLDAAERYAAGAWTPLSPSGITGNVSEALALGTGQVLVRADGSTQARLYDPATGSWLPAGNQNAIRSMPSMTLLADGRVLVAGGSNLSSAELYDPRTRTWTPTGSMGNARRSHAAVLLPDGRVLVASGLSNSVGEVPSAELYDPMTGTWSPAAPPLVPRHYASLTLLPDGHALLAGGMTAGGVTNHAELYDPASNTWTATGAMGFPRNGYGMGTVLQSGRVLMAGGADGARNPQPMAEIYEPATGTWVSVGTMATPRENPTSTLLPDGDVLVAGGASLLLPLEFYADVERYSPDKGPGAVPVLDALPLLQQAGAPWVLNGSGFAGTGAPQLQLQRVENGQLWWYAAASFTSTSFALTAPTDLPAGLYMASIVVDGVPSQARLVRFVDAPQAPGATAGTGQATVTWTPLPNDRGNPPEGYVVTSVPASAGCTAAVPATTCTVAGLSGGTSYQFYVQARHPNGLGPRSLPSAPVTVAGPPAPPATATGVPGLSGPGVALLTAVLAGLALCSRRLRWFLR